MLPIIFINCKKAPFVDFIIGGAKRYETRTKNTLGRFLGEPVLLAETGHGRPVVKALAVIDEIISIRDKETWDEYKDCSWLVPPGSEYDWQPDTKVKWLYYLKDIIPCTPFVPKEGRRHGQVWMEYNG